jgi:aminoglycoside/choline kinase family phosphotransferase
MAHLPKPWVRDERLRGDASTRSYSRLWDTHDRTAILVRYPRVDRRRLARDLEVRDWCCRQGLRVPVVIDLDLTGGWAVLEDFGGMDAEQDMTAVAAGERLALGMRTITPLVTFAQMAPEDLPRWNAPLGCQRLRWELAGLELWYMRHRCGVKPSSEVGEWLDRLAAAIADHPKRVCHRDYHLNNLFFVSEGEVGLIDYQDVLVGPDTYDAVSLLGERAMPVVLDKNQRDRIRNSWAERTGAAAGWRDRWRLVAIQRGLKVLGTFARLAASGAEGYQGWMAALARDLSPELAAVDAPPELVDSVKS